MLAARVCTPGYMLSPACAGSLDLVIARCWGLHPRLYAVARLRGLKKELNRSQQAVARLANPQFAIRNPKFKVESHAPCYCKRELRAFRDVSHKRETPRRKAVASQNDPARLCSQKRETPRHKAVASQNDPARVL